MDHPCRPPTVSVDIAQTAPATPALKPDLLRTRNFQTILYTVLCGVLDHRAFLGVFIWS